MAIEIKRQQLLNKKSGKKKKPQQAPKKPGSGQTKLHAPAVSKAKVEKKSGVVKKIFTWFFALVAVGLIIVPKPQLLVYEKLSMVATSIYMPGWFGSPGKLLDSPQRVVIDRDLGLVYLCFGEVDFETQTKEKCNRFKFIRQEGMFAAYMHYRSQ